MELEISTDEESDESGDEDLEKKFLNPTEFIQTGIRMYTKSKIVSNQE
jgi:hypothetical protein